MRIVSGVLFFFAKIEFFERTFFCTVFFQGDGKSKWKVRQSAVGCVHGGKEVTLKRKVLRWTAEGLVLRLFYPKTEDSPVFPNSRR